jgi:hypothetical protein
VLNVNITFRGGNEENITTNGEGIPKLRFVRGGVIERGEVTGEIGDSEFVCWGAIFVAGWLLRPADSINCFCWYFASIHSSRSSLR